MATTKIEWADKTWSPVTGCSPVSAGCANCFANRMSKRLAGRFGYPQDDPFTVTFHKDRIDEPDKWRKPKRVFVVSMGDLFHDDVTDHQLEWVFWKMANLTRHTFLVLTKRVERAAGWLNNWIKIYKHGGFLHLPNVHIGVSVEDQKTADERIPHLLRTPAAVRFISAEPLLGTIDLKPFLPHDFNKEPHCSWCEDCIHTGQDEGWKVTTEDFHGPFLDGIILGGETGPRARPMHPDWVQSIRDQCVETETNFFFKSWGAWQNGSDFQRPNANRIVLNDGRMCREPEELGFTNYAPEGWSHFYPTMMAKVGKKHSGRHIDGRTWDQLPERFSTRRK